MHVLCDATAAVNCSGTAWVNISAGSDPWAQVGSPAETGQWSGELPPLGKRNNGMALPALSDLGHQFAVRLIVDGASLEVFVNGGLASAYFPVSPTVAALRRAAAGGVRIFAEPSANAAAGAQGATEVSAVAAAYVLSGTQY